MASDYCIKESRYVRWFESEQTNASFYDVHVEIDGISEEKVLRIRKFMKEIADED